VIRELIDRGALFVANHSGGKDSQAALIALISEGVPSTRILVVHTSLGEAEWPGALEHAEQHAKTVGCDFIVARASKTFFDMVEHRFATRPDAPSWPSAKHRQCTSDLKRGPIEREVRRYADARGFAIIVNVLGLRAEESVGRAKRAIFSEVRRNWTAGREWFEYLPIHDYTTEEVFATIREAGQTPHHAYSLGNERLSCVFCIMSSKNDMVSGAKHNPELLTKYADLEKKTGYTMHMSRKPITELATA
jgi:3'-phosphoadenosine 5'-phosphosulfate sulfotransferase (PAPS reductase)/FAD synthetase